MKKQSKKKSKNKSIVLGITLILLIMLTLLGIAYGFYETNIIGNEKVEQSANLISDKLELIYEDTDESQTITDTINEEKKNYSNDFTVRNKSKNQSVKYTIILDNIENDFVKTWDWTYKLYKIEKNGKPIEDGEENPIAEGVIGKELKRQVIRAEEEIESKGTNKYKLKVTYDSTTPDGKLVNEEGIEEPIIETGTNLKFRINIMGVNENIFKEDAQEGTLLYAIGKNNPIVNPLTIPGRQGSTEDEHELSYTKDDYGTSYYFRGAVTNNLVNFNNMCWRIVRVQGNGDIKLFLAREDGTCETIPSFSGINKVKYTFADVNSSSTDVTFENSNAKKILDIWLNEKFQNQNSIVETEWCSDTSMKDETYYNGYKRLATSTTATPNLQCNFVGINNTESTKYKGKIALLTGDEFEYGGAGFFNNFSFLTEPAEGSYSEYCMMTPRSSGIVFIKSLVSGSGNDGLYITSVSSADFLIPMIVLNKNVTISQGNGTKTEPYIISES